MLNIKDYSPEQLMLILAIFSGILVFGYYGGLFWIQFTVIPFIIRKINERNEQ